MKNILLLLALLSTFFFTSCEGDQGPPGPPGGLEYGQVFEVTVDFNAGNDYSRLIDFPSNIVVYESDAVLVYLLEDTQNTVDIWTQLPRTYFPIGGGTLVYNFDHTFLDVQLFLGANFDLDTLGSVYTDNQTFRIAIIPAEYASADLSMDELLELMQMNSSDIENPIKL